MTVPKETQLLRIGLGRYRAQPGCLGSVPRLGVWPIGFFVDGKRQSDQGLGLAEFGAVGEPMAFGSNAWLRRRLSRMR
jgi:hypothetical protein